MDRLESSLSILRSFVPPDLSLHYLVALVGPILELIGMTAGAMLLAYTFSLPLGLYLGSRMRGTGALHTMLSGVRAVPDLTLAIFCVILVGVGPAAGMIAMAIFYTAAIGKIFGDLFRTADVAPLEALRATGASGFQVAVFGLLPLRLSDVLTYGSYEFESAIRASVIVGAVGGGGLGAELVGTLNAFDFQRTTTLILVLVLMVAVIDQVTVRLRRNPKWLAVLLPPAAYALWTSLTGANSVRSRATHIRGHVSTGTKYRSMDENSAATGRDRRNCFVRDHARRRHRPAARTIVCAQRRSVICRGCGPPLSRSFAGRTRSRLGPRASRGRGNWPDCRDNGARAPLRGLPRQTVREVL